jgi:hypothetical protein
VRKRLNPEVKIEKGLSSAEKEAILSRERSRIKAQKELKKQIAARKTGSRIAYDKLRIGTKTDRGRRIVRCQKCKKNGELSNGNIWGASVLIVHRGRIKNEKFIMTEFCMNSRGTAV